MAAALGLATLALFAALAPAMAQEGRWWANPRVAERLGISDEQAERIDEIAFAQKERSITLRAEVEKANLEMARMLDEPELDEARVATLIDRLVEARCALMRDELEARAAIAAVLTPEQRQKVLQLREAINERREELPRRRLRR